MALIAGKSRLMKGTVLSNELSTIMLMTELAYVVKRALGDQVKEVVYISDSKIALSGLPGGSDKPSPKLSFKIPKKSPNTDSQNIPKNPYIDDMKRRT